MKRSDMVTRVRSVTRDFSNSIFREQDIVDFINEGVDRFRQYIPELASMIYLDTRDSEPILLPTQYHHLLSVYSASRCFSQDERHYQATTLMNEFETKLDELKSNIESGQIVIVDATTGETITATFEPDYVNLKPYWNEDSVAVNFDEGVEGVE